MEELLLARSVTDCFFSLICSFRAVITPVARCPISVYRVQAFAVFVDIQMKEYPYFLTVVLFLFTAVTPVACGSFN